MKRNRNFCKAAFMAVAVAGGAAGWAQAAEPTNPHPIEASQSQTVSDTIAPHGPTGCEGFASSDGIVELACFGNPYQGDPNPGMFIRFDEKTNELFVSNHFEITPDGGLNELPSPKEQTYKLAFEEDHSKVKGGTIEQPSLADMEAAWHAADDETGTYRLESENGNLSVSIYDPGKVSGSIIALSYTNPDNQTNIFMTVDPNTVAVHKTVPNQSFSTAITDLNQNFTAKDFRQTKKPGPTGPGA